MKETTVVFRLCSPLPSNRNTCFLTAAKAISFHFGVQVASKRPLHTVLTFIYSYACSDLLNSADTGPKSTVIPRSESHFTFWRLWEPSDLQQTHSIGTWRVHQYTSLHKTHVREVVGSNLGLDTSYPACGIHSFPQFLQANCRIEAPSFQILSSFI